MAEPNYCSETSLTEILQESVKNRPTIDRVFFRWSRSRSFEVDW
jgi:hypothetical protein